MRFKFRFHRFPLRLQFGFLRLALGLHPGRFRVLLGFNPGLFGFIQQAGIQGRLQVFPGFIQCLNRIGHKLLIFRLGQFQRLGLFQLGADHGGGLVSYGANQITKCAHPGRNRGQAGGFGFGLGGFLIFLAAFFGLDGFVNWFLNRQQFRRNALGFFVNQAAAF